MKFEAKGRNYTIDKFGVVTQTDHRPYVYDPAYSAIYDKPEYQRGSEILQALRFGFVQGAHGKEITSIMDIGYGNAAFINFIKKHVPYVYGYDITGVPLDGAYVMPELVKADVACMWDVLEHFPDCSFLKDLQYETICISLPYCHFHTQGLSWFENEYPHLKPDEHIRHFNPWSLTAFMNSFGWRAVAESKHENVIRSNKGIKEIVVTRGDMCYLEQFQENSILQNIISMAFKR